MPKKKILIVEDDKATQEAYLEAMPEFEIFQAVDYASAVVHFRKHKNKLDAIVLDGKLGSSQFGHHLATAFRADGYRGPMLATSSDSELNQKLMAAGCDHIVQKHEVAEFLKKLFA